MRERLLQFLRCPNCGQRLTLAAYSAESDEVTSGLLTCSCGEWYPVVRGVPRLLRGDLRRTLVVPRNTEFFEAYGRDFPPAVRSAWERDDAGASHRSGRRSLEVRTAESFGFEWTTFHRQFDSYRENFLNYVSPINESFFRNKLVLDAGCGQGRHAYWAAKFGAEVVALDLGDAVETTAENCRGLPVHVVQADLSQPPFARSSFDYIFSIGVLHHLPDPRQGFLSLVPFVKAGGTISIWVYGRRHNRRAIYLYEPLRAVTRHLPHRVLRILCLAPALVVQGLNGLSRLLARAKFTRGIAAALPFSYYAKFPFAVKWNDAFDVLATPRSTYWKEEEIRDWFEEARLTNIQIIPLRKSSVKGFGRRSA